MSNHVKNQQVSATSSFSRNDGFKIKTNVEQSKDNQTFAVRLDVDSLPVPPRRYLAEFCFVSRSEEFINLFFCEKKLFNDEIKTCLTIRFPLDELEDILPNIKNQSDNLDEGNSNLLLDCNMRNEPEQHVKLTSNIAFIAASGPEACIDFYHVSAFSKQLLKVQQNELGVEPIVRVDLTTSTLDKLVNTLYYFINIKKQEGITK